MFIFPGFADTNKGKIFVISSFRQEADENCAVLGYYAASSGESLPTFRYEISVPSSRVGL